MYFHAIYLFVWGLMKTLYSNVWNVYSNVWKKLRSLNKYFLHRTTKLCELQRIIYGTVDGYKRISQVEQALANTQNVRLKYAINALYNYVETNIQFTERKYRAAVIKKIVRIITLEKAIDCVVHYRFVTGMEKTMMCICAFKLLRVQAERDRTTTFRLDNELNERKLLKVWNGLMDEKLTGMNTKQWGDIGFQGTHPSTDLRGAGMLAVESLLYLVQNYKNHARQLVSLSAHPEHGYPFGCLSVQMSYLAYQILMSEAGKTHFYNVHEKYPLWHREDTYVNGVSYKSGFVQTSGVPRDSLLDILHELYVALLLRFNKHWFVTKPPNIMSFGPLKSAFEKNLYIELRDPNCAIIPSITNI